MKLGRNDPCPCGSGKKYKRCCMSNAGKINAQVMDDFEQIVAMNPNITLDELNLVAQSRMAQRNSQPLDDFCGLSPTQMSNWMYAGLADLKEVDVKVPDDLAASPVMSYLKLILDEAMANGGSFKATAKGNLPANLVKQASEQLPTFAVAVYETEPSISDFTGSNEDKFRALHYTRVLAEVAGIIYRRSGRYHVKKDAQKRYLNQGISAFFMPMLEAAIYQYNWAYFGVYDVSEDLSQFWVFMLWRLQTHRSVDQLNQELAIAFPALLDGMPESFHASKQETLSNLVESRFVTRFLQFWGFITLDPRRYQDGQRIERIVNLQPLLRQTFTFLL
ncbi:SEC-C metal-binding domain-containing protein [Motilimonas eburnea]|uniref:SEC-C metal-binding domain-containing protein n=1 Tax=Motilimonas eburnea TaxID=1737488 RepID=UPI001E4D2E45|nr:SEC-C metal-binding domain-containing protein [Motilimonas eburnea]MCE2572674.1 SEC-C domain-containing protein [Motilimonas eburnea]